MAENFDVEREKLNLENRKIEIEREKLKLEVQKSRWTAISIIVPVLLGTGSIIVSLLTSYQSSKQQFQVKAAEIIFAGKNNFDRENRLLVLKSIFPDQTSSINIPRTDSLSSFGSDLSTTETDAKKDLLNLITQKAKSEKEVIDAWHKLFPGDDFVLPLLQGSVK